VNSGVKVRPVYPALNTPMTLMGVERRMFFFILTMALVLYHLSGALSPALLLFAILWFLAKGATIHDPKLLRILLNSSRIGVRYDPALWEKGRRWNGR